MIVTTRNVSLLAFITLLGTHTALASNVVIDMSQVEDYTQYQMDLQQCEGLAVQNQPDAPQRESVAGTAVKGAAVGAAAGAVGGKPAPRPQRRAPGLVSSQLRAATVAVAVRPVPMPARRPTRS